MRYLGKLTTKQIHDRNAIIVTIFRMNPHKVTHALMKRFYDTLDRQLYDPLSDFAMADLLHRRGS